MKINILSIWMREGLAGTLALVCSVASLHECRAEVGDSLQAKNYHLGEVVVSAQRKLVSNNSVSTLLDKQAIDRSMGKSLAAMLESVSGVSSIQTGTTVSKPVIQGMYGNRILLVNNDARQTGQQWGADHAPEIDKNASDKIEVVKGAEAVRYGSEALGGIIVMEQNMLPYGNSRVGGKLLSMYGSNGRRYQLVGHVEGAMPFLPSLAWRVQSTYANSGDGHTAAYMLNNTGSREFDLSASLGYKHKNLRAEVLYSRYNLKMGVLYNAQMGDESLLAERIELGRPTEILPFSRHIDYPFQHVIHNNAMLKLFLTTSEWGRFYWTTSFQQDDREENRIRRMNLSRIPAVSMHLKSWQNQLRWRMNYGMWQSEAGVQITHINHENERGTGVTPIIPNHTELTLGAYALQKVVKNRWGAEAGARFDWQDTKAAGYDWTGDYYGGHRHFANFTYSVSGHYHFCDHFILTSNLGLAWRAPHVYELYSNGNELGSGRFVRGDSAMKSENSYKWITSCEYKSHYIDVRVDGYLQWVKNYIYDSPTREHITVLSGTYPLFQYMQTDAFLRGVDLDVRVRPLSTLAYHFITAMIWANERRTNNYLPYIPSFRFDHSLSFTPSTVGKWTPWIEVKHRFVARQKRFDPKTDLVNEAPPAYHLFGFEVGVEWKLNARHSLRLLLAGDNVFNHLYKEYTNRARYYSHDIGRDMRLSVGWKF